ncbi:hypothetical protein NIES4071_28070 [Calothrix sp. NIES-4071]|nr:hypothetical protein NIES4071_28070 [Calothrix sp. NIES-4071]BAZ57129.1 hypothetical protein NIES4105_28010 [Calothrix sp. NIES-4105]
MNSQLLNPTVLGALTDFENSKTPGVWASVDKKQLVSEMRLRLNDPFQINQGTQPFCGPAAIVFELVRKQPLRYIQICRSLFETGSCNLMTIKIAASQTLRRSNGRLRMSQSDWMILAALRESENSIFNIEAEAPDIIRNIAGMTKPWEMRGWARELLSYRNSNFRYTYLFGEFQALQEASKAVAAGGVAFALVTADGLLRGKTPFLPLPTHWISILGNISIKGGDWFSDENGRISLDVYSWGRQYHINLDEAPFEDYFWGVVIGM